MHIHPVRRVGALVLAAIVIASIPLLVHSSPALAQAAAPSRLHGQVVDTTTGIPLSGASVRLVGTRRGAVTDARGFFALPPEPGATRGRVRVDMVGYDAVELEMVAGAPDAITRIPLSAVAIPIEGAEVRSIIAATGTAPGAFSDVDRATIVRDHRGQDLPMLLGANVPGTYAYSDAGNGIGYSYLKIRGFGQRRIGVTINGIPLNDPQSREVYWIDHPDLAMSAQSIQVQRGVGSSVYGTTALGGSVDVETIPFRNDPELVLEAGGGSFGTQRFSIQAASGLLDEAWSVNTRLSRIRTDGYRESSWSDLWSYFLGVAHVGTSAVTRLNLYGGPERTHLSYLGVPRPYLDGAVTGDADRDRRFNPLTYDGERDEFFEPHYELLHDWKVSPTVSLSNALFYFQGTGFYDEFRTGRDLRDYGYPDSIVTDIVRRRNAKNLQVGWVPRARWAPGGAWSFETGLDLRYHEGERWGELQWAATQPPNPTPDHVYYAYVGKVTNTSGFVRAAWQARPDVVVRGDLALHRQEYRLTDDAFRGYNFDEDYVFLMPRVGATWKPRADTELYASWSRGEAEPIFRELYDPENAGTPPGFAALDPATGTLSDPLIDPERVDDLELGVRVANPRGEATLGLYWMKFVDEIVYNGRIDDNGNPITGNAARSRHAGIEGSFTLRPARRLELGGNFHVADDRFDEYLEYFDATTTTDYSGNRIAGFPEWAARGRAQLGVGAGSLDVAIDHAGRQSLDNTENERKNPALRDDPTWEDRTIEPWTAVSIGGRWTFPGALGGRALELDVRVHNVFDERYETAGYVDYPAPAFTPTPVWIPAATRNVYAGVKAKF